MAQTARVHNNNTGSGVFCPRHLLHPPSRSVSITRRGCLTNVKGLSSSLGRRHNRNNVSYARGGYLWLDTVVSTRIGGLLGEEP